MRKAHESGATITANHPYYSYGLFYAHGKDAIPGGYVDGFDMIEINAYSDDGDSIKVLNDAVAFWTAYLVGGEHMGKKVEKAHYLVGASDTHDVLFPGVKNDKGSSSVQDTGKARTYAFIGDVAGDHKTIGLATANAMRDGHSYLSFGPILNPAKIFGHKFAAENGVFEIAIDIQSLNGVKDVIVLSNLGSDKYTYNEEAYGDAKLVLENVLAVQSFNGENSLSFKYTAQLGDAKNVWFAIKVVDGSEHQMFAFSNPYWVSK